MTSTDPALCAGATAVIVPSGFTENVWAATPPKETPVAPVKLAPVIVTLVPPATGPALGLRLETVGAATKVN